MSNDGKNEKKACHYEISIVPVRDNLLETRPEYRTLSRQRAEKQKVAYINKTEPDMITTLYVKRVINN